jgi:hypothetical protein
MGDTGFEPVHPKILDLESSALDHSANHPSLCDKLPLPGGLEPPILRLTVARLNQLGHRSNSLLISVVPFGLYRT